MSAGERDLIEEALMRAPDIHDDGFTSRVMARLPPSRRRLRAAILLASGAAAAAATGLFLPGAVRMLAGALAALQPGVVASWGAPLGLAAAALLFGELGWVESE